MRTRISALTVAALACTGALAAPAGAHPAPFTVKAGSAPTGAKVAFTATSGTVAIKNTNSNTTTTCSSVTLPASLTVSSAAAGSRLATIDGAKVGFAGCTTVSGWKVTITGYGVWYVNASDSTNGTTTVTISNIRAHVVWNSGPTCAYDLGADTGSFSSSDISTVPGGTVGATYTNSTRSLQVKATNPGTIGAWNVRGTVNPSVPYSYCLAPSVLKPGDKSAFGSSFAVAAAVPAYDPISIG